MKKPRNCLVLLLAAVLLLSGCGKTVSAVPEASGPPPEPVPAAVEPPLWDWAQEQPLPDFLDEEQQQIFQYAFCAAGSFLMGCSTLGVENFPLADGTQPAIDAFESVELDGWTYTVSQGRYRQWTDFQAMLDGLFTPEYQEELIWIDQGDGTKLPTFRATQDGILCFLEGDRGSSLEYELCDTPDSYELTSQTEDEICFDLIAHYAVLDYEGYDGDALEQIGEQIERFPIRMVRTEQGWRVAEIHVPW